MDPRSVFSAEHSPELSLVLRLTTAQAEVLGEHRYVTRSGSSLRSSGDPPLGYRASRGMSPRKGAADALRSTPRVSCLNVAYPLRRICSIYLHLQVDTRCPRLC